MLVFSRMAGEQICIGDHVLVKVTKLGESTVRLGVQASGLRILKYEKAVTHLPVEASRPLIFPPQKEKSMLVLSRKKDEKIVIGDNITIMVIDIQGDKVRLGIEAPREVPVHREEVYEAIQKEEKEMAEQAKKQVAGEAEAKSA